MTNCGSIFEQLLPAIDLLAFRAHWLDEFFSDGEFLNMAPLKKSDLEYANCFDQLIRDGVIGEEITQNGAKRVFLTEYGGEVWEKRRNPNWDAYFDYLEDCMTTQEINITSIQATVSWQEIAKQIAFGRIEPKKIVSCNFGFFPDERIVYWKPQLGVFRMTLIHNTPKSVKDNYWDSLTEWKESWSS